jgi:phenylacetate-coenzyme A ligase PaaK-like adenylate-forming protein
MTTTRPTVRPLLTSDDALDVLRDARRALTTAARGRDVVAVFGRAAARLRSDAAWAERAAACVRGFYGEGRGRDADLAQAAMLPDILDRDAWERRVESELVSPRALEGAYETAGSDALVAYAPLGVVLHVCPGNSFFGGLESMLLGLVTGNANVVKLSRSAPPVAAIVLELLEACGLPRGQATLVSFDPSRADVDRALCSGIDAAAVWGGDAVVRHYKEKLGPGVRLLEFGPKLSFSVLTAAAAGEALDGIASDACKFEQVSCSSSQALFVESKGDAATRSTMLARIGDAFARYAAASPAPGKTPDEQVEILKVAERAKLDRAQGSGDFASGYPDWLVVWMGDAAAVEPSPLFRTLRVYAYEDLADLARRLAPVRHYLQTASIGCAPAELMGMTDALWAAGVNRVVDAGRSTTPTVGAPHDGSFLLTQFCRVVSLESPARTRNLWQSGTRDYALKQIAKTIRTASAAPFYARRFEAAGIENGELRTWEQLHAIPWLRKEDIYEYGPPRSSDLLTRPFEEVEGAYLLTTGGSTGEPRYTLYARHEWEEATEIFARELKTLGIGRRDRVANLFIGGGLWSGFIAVTEALEKVGCMNLPVGGDMNPVDALRLFKKFGVTAVFGVPSTLLRLAHAVGENPELAVRIPKILYGGELMTETMREHVKKVFGAEIVKSGSYSAVDGGCIGYQCAHAEGAVQHALESYCHVEICDEETGRPVAPGEAGELVVTNLSRTLFPVVRLRTGDRARALPGCACGTSALTFELLGRSDDMIRAGGGNIFVADVDRLCKAFEGTLSLVYQLRMSKQGVDDRYDLVIETARVQTGDELRGLTDQVTQKYLEIAGKLRQQLEGGYLRHFAVALVPPGTLEANERTGKIRRVVDAR